VYYKYVNILIKKKVKFMLIYYVASSDDDYRMIMICHCIFWQLCRRVNNIIIESI